MSEADVFVRLGLRDDFSPLTPRITRFLWLAKLRYQTTTLLRRYRVYL